MKTFWKYTLARFALFAVVFAILWLVTAGVRPQLPVPFILIAAFIVSGVISIFTLRRMREEVATHFSSRGNAPAKRDADDLD